MCIFLFALLLFYRLLYFHCIYLFYRFWFNKCYVFFLSCCCSTCYVLLFYFSYVDKESVCVCLRHRTETMRNFISLMVWRANIHDKFQHVEVKNKRYEPLASVMEYWVHYIIISSSNIYFFYLLIHQKRDKMTNFNKS